MRPTLQKENWTNYFVIKNYRKETQTELSLSKSTLTFSFISSANIFFVLTILQLSEEIRCFRVKAIKKRFMAIYIDYIVWAYIF